MRYMASIYVSDVMDLIALTVEIQQWDEMYGPPELAYQKTYQWPGLGRQEPRAWLLDAVRNLHVDMTAPPGRRGVPGVPMGGPHTISGSGDGGL
jgi:hypothetical protein